MIALLIAASCIWIGITVDAIETKKVQKYDYDIPRSRVSMAVSNGFLYAGAAAMVIGMISIIARDLIAFAG